MAITGLLVERQFCSARDFSAGRVELRAPAQARQDDADPLFRAMLLAGCAADLANMGFDRGLRPGFRSHRRSIVTTMISKSVVRDASQGVSRMLTGNTTNRYSAQHNVATLH